MIAFAEQTATFKFENITLLNLTIDQFTIGNQVVERFEGEGNATLKVVIAKGYTIRSSNLTLLASITTNAIEMIDDFTYLAFANGGKPTEERIPTRPGFGME